MVHACNFTSRRAVPSAAFASNAPFVPFVQFPRGHARPWWLSASHSGAFWQLLFAGFSCATPTAVHVLPWDLKRKWFGCQHSSQLHVRGKKLTKLVRVRRHSSGLMPHKLMLLRRAGARCTPAFAMWCIEGRRCASGFVAGTLRARCCLDTLPEFDVR